MSVSLVKGLELETSIENHFENISVLMTEYKIASLLWSGEGRGKRFEWDSCICNASVNQTSPGSFNLITSS